MGFDARDTALAAIAASCEDQERAALVRVVRQRGALTMALLLRSLLGGERELFNAALAELSGQRHARIAAFARDPRGEGFAALALKAGLPRHALPAFRAALKAIETLGSAGPPGLKPRLIDATTSACEARNDLKLAPILSLLWRFAAEAARAQARDAAREAEPDEAQLPQALVFVPPANDQRPPAHMPTAIPRARLVALKAS